MPEWWTHVCEYGHFDCSYVEGGPCGDEYHGWDDEDEWEGEEDE